jgi:hypothetical protein
MDTREMTFFDKLILGKPMYRGVVEWLILVIIGVLGEVFSWGKIPFRPYSMYHWMYYHSRSLRITYLLPQNTPSSS